jgi:hypothetical protein
LSSWRWGSRFLRLGKWASGLCSSRCGIRRRWSLALARSSDDGDDFGRLLDGEDLGRRSNPSLLRSHVPQSLGRPVELRERSPLRLPLRRRRESNARLPRPPLKRPRSSHALPFALISLPTARSVFAVAAHDSLRARGSTVRTPAASAVVGRRASLVEEVVLIFRLAVAPAHPAPRSSRLVERTRGRREKSTRRTRPWSSFGVVAGWGRRCCTLWRSALVQRRRDEVRRSWWRLKRRRACCPPPLHPRTDTPSSSPTDDHSSNSTIYSTQTQLERSLQTQSSATQLATSAPSPCRPPRLPSRPTQMEQVGPPSHTLYVPHANGACCPVQSCPRCMVSPFSDALRRLRS